MREPLNWTPDRPLPTPAKIERLTDAIALKLRWRYVTRPPRSIPAMAELHISRAASAADAGPLPGRWRPLSAPSQPVPPWRWPSRARAERASQRASARQRWRPLTAR